ncbi:serine hydrolase [Methanofollis aquaemaris]|uniref:Serine hydrolase n=1 Tax=Methanofollis aquaemaris TaxID=126734 RepID=A0A8A3S9C1_9EURY|nr:serine hydrolase [Methanofollis aquaemaris]QSZ68211.1 serine hydrolase [Methanofollis aquaemaris]
MPKKILLLMILIAAALILAAGCTQTTSENRSAGKLDGFDVFVTRTMTEYEVPGAVVGIVENDSVVYLKGFGVREIGKPGVVGPDTRFQIASVTKYITAQAIGTLVDEGKLDWDTPVVTYMPDFAFKEPYVTGHATLRDLLAHRTGFKEYDGDMLGRLGYSNREMLERMRYLDLPYGFREKYAYSNAGYFIAGEVAAGTDNRSWENLTDARILRPLDMTRSGAHPETLYLDDNHVVAHGGSEGNVTVIPLEEAAFPAGGQVVSTGRDMTQVLRMMLNDGSVDGKQVLSKKTVAEIHTASLVAGRAGPLGDPDGAVCLGCDAYDFLGERVIEKNGALEGVRSIVILVPDRKVGLVVIANKQLTVFPEAVRDEFLERYIGRSGIDLQAREKLNQKGWYSLLMSMEVPADAQPAAIPAAAIAGTYTSDLYGTMILTAGPDADTMTVLLGPAEYPGTLEHQTGDTWYLSWPNPDDAVGYLTFAANPSGTVTGFTSDDYGPFARA